jgi:hypothetical protein
VPKSIDRDARGQLAASQAPDDLAAEAVVAQPRVADAGDEDLLLERLRHAAHLQLAGEEEEVAADVAHELLAGIVVDGHAEVTLSS